MSYKEQIMSKDKDPNIFSPEMEAIVFIFILQIFFVTCAVLKIGGYSQISPSFSWGDIRSHDVFRPIACERKDLMDYNCRVGRYVDLDLADILVDTLVNSWVARDVIIF